MEKSYWWVTWDSMIIGRTSEKLLTINKLCMIVIKAMFYWKDHREPLALEAIGVQKIYQGKNTRFHVGINYNIFG